ncbi:MAG TPA: hypothetical protein VIM07_15635 [Chitinophagaceae bacterium]
MKPNILMKQLIFATLLFFTATVHAQVGIGTATPNTSAQLDITSVNKGLLIPRMTSAQVAAISSPATGLLVFQTDNTPGFYYYNGTAWSQFLSGGVLPVNRGGTGVSSHPSGNILFGNGTSAINNSDNLFWDNTNSRLGILNSAPSATFQIGTDGSSSADNLKWGVMNGFNTLQLGYRQTGWKLKAGNNSGVITDLVFATTDGSTDVDRMSIDYNGLVDIGKLRAGSILYPVTNGNNGQVLTTDGSGTASWGDMTATAYSGILPITNGGTGSATKNFVDLTTDQTIAGIKTFNSDMQVNGLNIGKGIGQNGENTSIGFHALGTGTGSKNTAIGYSAMANYNGSSIDNNSSVGYNNMVSLSNGQQNTSMGAESMMSLTSGTANTSMGAQTFMSNTGNENTAIGYAAGSTVTTGSKITLVGTHADVSSGGLTNSTAIGSDAVVSASNTIQLGNTSVTSVNTSAKLTTGAITFPNTDGSGGQALVTNGSGTVSWGNVVVRDVADEVTATDAQTSFTLTQTPSANSKVKMYINGIRISNTAYSISGTTLTYTASANGSYTLVAGDRIQFDYYY